MIWVPVSDRLPRLTVTGSVTGVAKPVRKICTMSSRDAGADARFTELFWFRIPGLKTAGAFATRLTGKVLLTTPSTVAITPAFAAEPSAAGTRTLICAVDEVDGCPS